jgi:hypothetical protein
MRLVERVEQLTLVTASDGDLDRETDIRYIPSSALTIVPDHTHIPRDAASSVVFFPCTTVHFTVLRSITGLKALSDLCSMTIESVTVSQSIIVSSSIFTSI